jgi:Damage-control phosphatase ARMT1-like domain
MRPPPPPPPLRTDGSNPFAHYSMSVRVPKILEEVTARNPDYAPAIHEAIARLRDDIRGNGPLPAPAFPAPDAGEWEAAVAARAGETWLGTDWFFAECYVYRCLMSAVRYWETGRDPFAPAKREELASDALWQSVDRSMPERRATSDGVRSLLTRALWGNRVDLSYAVGVAFGAAGHENDLLVDDSAAAAELLLRAPRDVHIIADNTGSELAMDLLLAELLLGEATATGPRARVSLHVKMHPTFVSDAIALDVWALVDAFEQHGSAAGRVAASLRQAWADERLRVLPDPYWNGPRFLWERPPRLERELDRATAVILKGDANYRRADGDALWPSGIGLAEATRYFPAPLIAVRTMKSDSLVGVPSDEVARLDAADPDWRINGRRGVIQVGGGQPTR